MNEITEDEIANVCALIFAGRTFEPVPRCGRVLAECCIRGLFATTDRAVPTLTAAGEKLAQRVELLR